MTFDNIPIKLLKKYNIYYVTSLLTLLCWACKRNKFGNSNVNLGTFNVTAHCFCLVRNDSD